MTQAERTRFQSLRRRVADYIREYLKDDCGHESYEWTWELLVSYPNYFEDETAEAPPDFFQITLHCYVLGPGRHYDWTGKSWDEALTACESDINAWISEELSDHGQAAQAPGFIHGVSGS